VFLDAFVPEHGDSLNGLINKALAPEVAAQFVTTSRGAAAEGNSGLMQRYRPRCSTWWPTNETG
jgi:hypothetical protein